LEFQLESKEVLTKLDVEKFKTESEEAKKLTMESELAEVAGTDKAICNAAKFTNNYLELW
jgi:hypothetical protein